MIKRIAFAALTLLLLAASMGYAANMQVNSSAAPLSGGTITPNGIAFYSTDTATYTVSAKSGWSLSSVLIDGVDATGGQIIVSGSTYKVAYDTSKVHTIKANFAQASYSISTSASAGGTILVTGGANVNITPGSARDVIIAPASGYKIASLTVDGTPVTPADPTVAFTQSYTNIQSNKTVSATFSLIPTATVSAGSNMAVAINTPTLLTGSVSSNSTPSAYLWQLTSGPAGATITSDTTLTPTFNATAQGTYTVTLTAIVGGQSFLSAPATITVKSASMLASNNCTTCHAANPVPLIAAPAAAWLTSRHAASSAGASCPSCHMPNAEAHPGQIMTTITTTNTICNACHTQDSQGNVANHPLAIGTNTCHSCHDSHSLIASAPSMMGAPHFNNISTGLYPASYLSSEATLISKAACLNCHATGPTNNRTIRQQWAKSGHAATTALPWIANDFKTQNDCVRCHTTTGFIAYSSAKMTAAWGVATDKSKEVLACVGCHSDVATGTVRTVTPNQPFADETGYTNHNVGISNICMDCHSGSNNGASIEVQVGNNADFSTLAFIPPHYLTAGGSLHGKSGYQFPGRTYADYSSNSHRKIGMSDTKSTGTDGPCVTCHMSAPNKHAFKSVSTAQSGSITAVTTTVCTNCHGATLPAATLDAKRVEFNNALDILKAQLASSNHPYSPDYPYFTAGSWGTGQAGANVMGAAFNYKLLLAEPGAYAHNPVYAKQLIVDSIDAAYNGGTVTGDISSALASLVSSGAITQQVADSLTTSNSCNSCHGYPPASTSHSLATTSPQNCANCHIYTTPGASTHNNGTVDFKTLVCGSCHLTAATVPALATGSHSIHFAAIVSTDPAIVCTRCHTYNGEAVLPHRNGTLDVTYSGCSTNLCHGTFAPPVWGTASGNNTCTKCHGTGTATVTAANRYVVAPSDATATGTGKVSPNAKIGAHQTHLRMFNGLSAVGTVDERCQNCHGTLPDIGLHANGSSTPAFQGLATRSGAMSAGYTGTNCSNTYCHNPAGAGGTLNPANVGFNTTPTWTDATYLTDGPLKTQANCNRCHKVPGDPGFTAAIDHGALTIASDCAGCHGHNGDTSGAAGRQHMDGIKYGNGACDTCHGYPPMSAAQFSARVGSEFVNAKVEDYAGGGGHHSTHLPTTVAASEGFTPCLPCHPNTYHGQGGGTVVKTNVNVFDAADMSFRFDDTRPKRYEVATQSCSNVSCHFQPTVSWQ